MKSSKTNYSYFLIALIVAFSAMPAFAANGSKTPLSPPANNAFVSNRLIVKLKPLGQVTGLSSAQIASDLRLPFSADTLNKLQTAAGVTLAESHAISNGAHIVLLQGMPDRQSIDRAINNIRGLSEVDYVEEDRILTSQLVPNDTYFNSPTAYLWGLFTVTSVASPAPGDTGSYGADFQTAWNTTTGTGVVVAVVDTGITAHTDIVGLAGTVSPATGNLVSPGYSFITDCRIRNTCAATTSNAAAVIAPSANASDLGDFISPADSTTTGSLFYGLTARYSSWHGTHVSGTIAAIGNNATGVVGGAYSAKILPVRVLGKGGGYTSDITEGMRWAANVHPTISNPNPAKVINLSLGGAGACSQTEQDAINAIVAAGTVLTIAAGNSNADAATASPANCNNVISVAAIGRDGSRAVYSNFSSPASNTSNPMQVTLAAQGGDKTLAIDPGIYSTINAGLSAPTTTYTYDYKQGTSMATPHVAAAAALMMSVNPALTPAQVKTILAESTTSFPSFFSAGWAAYDCATLKNCGAGILNAQLAVQNSVSPLTASSSEINFGTLSPVNNTISPVSMSVTLTNNSGATVTLGTAKVTGDNASVFSITSNNCTTILPGASCQLTISFLPVAFKTYVAGLFIPATAGAVVVGLSGKADITSAATALAAIKSGGGGGGCSIMSADSNADISLLFTFFAILLFSLWRRSTFVRL